MIGTGTQTKRLADACLDSALNLAIFRIAIAAIFLRLPDLRGAVDWATLPSSLGVPPHGSGWLYALLPIDEGAAQAAQYATYAGLGCGLLGVFGRLPWCIVTVSALYLLGIPQHSGNARHYHHLLWFAALLASSPCTDALALDRLLPWKTELQDERSYRYGIPIRCAWILIGLIYFFPGLWKLLESGIAWALSDNLRNQLYAKWIQLPEFQPLFRVDQYPRLLKLSALSVLALELGFLFALPFRRVRPIAVGGALIFHKAIALLMGIRFAALWQTYVVFVDWDALVRRLRKQAPAPSARTVTLGTRLSMLVGALIIAGNLVYGALGISDSWPLTCYPKFHRRLVRATLPVLQVAVFDEAGNEYGIPSNWLHPEGRTQRVWSLQWSLMGSHETARAAPERFAAYWMRYGESRSRIAGRFTRVRFYRDTISTVPEDRERVLRRQLLHEMTLPSR